MLITADDFRKRLDHKQLRIALVGMSNSGKSTCTALLTSELSFDFFEVDEAINNELGIDSMAAAAEWMGYPFEPNYQSNKQRYLELEAQFSRVKIPGQNFVLDTTGSIVYAKREILNWIRENFLVVGLRVSEELCQTLIEDYFVHPKTVIWGKEFEQKAGESGTDALKRCYPQLLKNRAALYSELSDVEIAADITRRSPLNARDVIEAIESALRNTAN